MQRLPVVFVFALFVSVLSTVAAAAPSMNADQLARYQNLTSQLRCLICQNRSIADSDAPLAADLRHIVERQILAGRSDRQIKQYLVDRYGDWVLYDPPFQFSTWLLWLGPFLLLLIALMIVVTMMRRNRGSELPPPTVDRDRLAAVLAEGSSPTDDQARTRQ